MPTKLLPRLAGRLFNRPLAVLPDAAFTIAHVFGVRTQLPLAFDEPVSVDRPTGFMAGNEATDSSGRPAGYVVTDGGVAVVSIVGELVNRGSWVGAPSGLVSYEGLQHTLKLAAADHRVTGIVLDIASPGGEVAGMLETAALVAKIGRDKPVVALANDIAASAAYVIASAARNIVTTHFGQVGSVGALIMHADMSGALAASGVKVTMVHTGRRKVDGNPYGALPGEVAARLQAQTDRVAADMAALVGRHRRMQPAAVMGLEAECFLGDRGIETGLADAVGTLDTVLAMFGKGSASRRRRGGTLALQARLVEDDAPAKPLDVERPPIEPDRPEKRRKQRPEPLLDHERADEHPHKWLRPEPELWEDPDESEDDMSRPEEDYDRWIAPSYDEVNDSYVGRARHADEGEDRPRRDSENDSLVGKGKGMTTQGQTAPENKAAKLSADKEPVPTVGDIEAAETNEEEEEEEEAANEAQTCGTDAECEAKFGAEDQVEEDENGQAIPLDDPRHSKNGGKGRKSSNERGAGDGGGYNANQPRDGQGQWTGIEMRQRIRAILTSPEAHGRGQLAEHLAFETGASAKAAIALLAKSPRTATKLAGAGIAGKIVATGNSPRERGRDIALRLNAMRSTTPAAAR